ncbi:DUF1648 domain-containing protein [Corynebacterium halotolerans]|uniref:DUF1648 domain-containing protein n=1 Tax=Corynebacterium halotolerans YIM 70093 = DSM 44683 TaxID=1121362 RepID=M1NWQ3_9CORY|nr:DUF1648 domain-containing protein [Corynebacterium halotolerans]AGF71920.1 hypothetical protein A605_04555 [Corynebacterium halotolerans YIM 70093 = DSM 44683]
MTEQVAEELRPVPWGWYGGIVVVTVLALVAVWANFDSIPDPMPVHWGPGGEADRFTDKSLGTAFLLVGLGPVILLAAGAGSAALIQSQARADGYPKRTAHELNRRRMGANLQQPALGALMLVLAVLMAASTAGSLLGWLGGVPMTVLLIGGIIALLGWFFVRMKRIGEHLDEVYPPDEPRERLKWGMFYFNPDDERTVIDMDGGSMTTFNFARPAAWGILAALLAPVALVVVLAVMTG